MSKTEIIIAELTGLPIRKVNPENMIQSGHNLCNRFGQRLWTIEAFHEKGIRVRQWPNGTLHDYTWLVLYADFYERVPDNERNAEDAP